MAVIGTASGPVPNGSYWALASVVLVRLPEDQLGQAPLRERPTGKRIADALGSPDDPGAPDTRGGARALSVLPG